MFAVLDARTVVPRFRQPSWLHYQHSIKFCLDIQQNGVKQKFNLLSRLALDGPGVDGPAACAGRADATSTKTRLLALRLRVEWGGLVCSGAGVGASERGGPVAWSMLLVHAIVIETAYTSVTGCTHASPCCTGSMHGLPSWHRVASDRHSGHIGPLQEG